VPHFNVLAGGDALRISGQTSPLQKLELLPYLIAEERTIVSSFV